MEMNQLSGALKAAILIHSMGRPAAERILNRLTLEEKELVNRHLDQMGEISSEVVEQVAKEFTARAQRAKSATGKSPASAAGAAQTQKQSGESGAEIAGLKALRSLNADEVLDWIKDEHPQTIAIVMVHMGTETASDVMSRNLPG